MKLLRLMAGAGVLFASAGCGILTEPKPLIDQFTWESVDNQSDITEGVSIAGIFGDISFLGQVKTPTLCYSVTPKLDVDGSNITVRVDVLSSGSGTCAQQAGGVRYGGSVLNLGRGTYTVRIIQTVSGVGTQEFTEEVKL
jgi:hypothetical protein